MVTQVITLNQRFDLPPGLINVVPTGDARDDSPFYVPPSDGPLFTADPIINSPDNNVAVSASEIVSFTIISQTIKFAADGTKTVDLVLDVPDQSMPDCDVRIAKI